MTGAFISKVLRETFGPTAQVQHIEDSGLKGARVITRESGTTWVHAQVFMSGTNLERSTAAAITAIEGLPNEL